MLKLLDRLARSSSPAKAPRLTRIRALEPRMVFDAAGAATADAAAAKQHHGDGGKGGAEASGPDWLPSGKATEQSGQASNERAGSASEPRGDGEHAQASGGNAKGGVDIVVVDANVPDLNTLLKGLPKNAEVIVIDPSKDSVKQLADALEGRKDVDSIHILSHGKAGELKLGSSTIDLASIEGKYADEFASIGKSFTADADMLIYGCDFGAGAKGEAAVEALARATKLDIAASDDATGHSSLGGDWDLEVTYGKIEHDVIIAESAQEHWENILAPATITVVGDPVVRDGQGNLITGTTANGVTTYAVNSNVVGSVSTWNNAGTVNGQQIALRATVVSIGESDDLVSFRTTADDAVVLIRDDAVAANGAARVEVRWEILDAATMQALAVDVNFQIGDIDGVGGNPNTRETVSTATSSLSSYTVAQATDLRVDTSGGRVSISGTQDENNPSNGTVSSQSIAGLSYANKTSFNITYALAANTVTGQAAFQHDGDFDLVITDPVTTYIPVLDLDASAGGSGYNGTFTEDAGPVRIVDTDVAITNDGDQLTNATVTLTNAQASDSLNVGTLPAGITATTDTSVAGVITVRLTGAASAADYQAALGAITFSNASHTPNTTARAIDISVANDFVSSDVQRSTIAVVPVNDIPTAGDDTFTTNEDTDATIDVLTNDSDLDGDTLTITQVNGLAITAGGASVAVTNGTVSLTNGGQLVFRPATNYNGPISFTYTVSDGNGGEATANVTGTVTAINDAPVNTLPPAFSTNEDTSVQLTGISVTDVDAAGGTITVTFNVGSGALTAATGGGVTIGGSGTDTITLTGTLADINAYLGSASAPTYAPGANANGPVTLTMTTNDGGNTGSGGALTDTDTATINIAAVNDAPVNTLPPTFATDEDTPVQLTGISVSDVDAAGGSITVTLTVGSGSLTATSGGGVTIGGSGTGTITLTGTLANINGYLGSASAPTFNPAANANGPVTLTMTTNDNGNTGSGGALSDTDGATINVASVEDIPVAGDDTFTTIENTPVTIDVLANDSDGDGDPLTVTEVNGTPVTAGGPGVPVTGGVVTLNNQGQLVFTPNPGYDGPTSFTYTVSDDKGNTDTGTVTGEPANDAPVNTLPPTFATDEDVPLQLTGIQVADPDAGNAPVTVTLTVGSGTLTATTGGGVTITGSGTGTITLTGSIADLNAYLASGAAPFFNPAQDANGPVTLTMTTDDGGNTGSGGPLTDTDTATINVAPVDDAPVANDDTFTISEDGVAIIDVTANDTDADGDPLVVTEVNGQPITAGGPAVTVTGGTVALNTNGDLVFTPTPNYNGPIAFTYTVSDGNGGTDVGQVNGTVTPVNDAPVNTIPPTFAGTEDTPLQLTGISVSDVDAGGGDITVTFTVGSGTLTAANGGGVTIAGSGSATITLTGTLAQINAYLGSTATAPVFNPAANANGPVSLTMTTDDGGNTGAGGAQSDTDVATINVAAVNDAPAANPDTFTIPEDGVATIDVTGNDVDVDGDPLTVTEVNGTPITIGGPAVPVTGGSVTLNADGDLVFTPTPNYNGPVSFTYTVSDGNGGTDTGSVSGTVTAVNDAPVNTIPPTFTATEDTPLQLTGISVTDVDAQNGPITVTFTVGSGTLTATSAGGVTIGGSGSGTITLTGTLAQINAYLGSNATAPVFTPVANANGPVSLTMTTDDGGNTGAGGAQTDTDTVTINVGAANDAPVNTIPAGGFTTNEDTSVPLTGIQVSDADAGNNPLTVTLNVGSGTIAAAPGTGVTVTGSGTGTITLTGTVADLNAYLGSPATAPVFTPAPDATGTVPLTVTTSDGTATDTDTTTVVVAPVNDAPINNLPAGGFSTSEDTPTRLTGISVTDVDAGNGNITVTLTVGSGTLTAASGAGVTIGGSGTGTITLTGSLAQINAYLGSNAAPLFTPVANVNGPVTLTMTTNDGGNTGAGGPLSDTDVVTINVAAVNDAPVANDDTFTGTEDGGPITIDVRGNDTDVDGDTLTVTQVNGQAITAGGPAIAVTGGTVRLTAGGDLVFTPNANYNGQPSFTYTVSDGNGGTATATVTGSISAVNDAPVNNLPAGFATNEDAPVRLTGISITDVDAGGGDITVTLTVGSGALSAANGGGVTVTGSGTGTITLTGTLAQINAYLGSNSAPLFTPVANANGPVTLTMTTNDRGNTGAGGPLSDTDTRVITVAAVNDAPVARDDSFTTTEDGGPVTINVRGNDTDVDGDTLTVTQVNGKPITAGGPAITVTGGTGRLTPGGDLVFTPNPNFNGATDFTYTVSDGHGGTDVATVRGTVTAVNDAPVNTMPAGGFGTREDTPVRLDGLSVTDVDAGNGNITVTLNVGSGALSAASGSGVTVRGSGTGTITLTGSLADINAYLGSGSAPTFTPVANANGPVTLTMTTNDRGNTGAGGALSDTDTRTINVRPVNDAPDADPIGDQKSRDSQTIDFAAGGFFSDVDGDNLSFTAKGLPPGLSIDPATGEITGTISRDASQNGTYIVTVTASDGNGGRTSVQFAWVVTNPAPDAVDDTATTPEDTPTRIDVLGNDSDPDGDPLTVTGANAQHGTVTINRDGTITYVPNPDFNGRDTIVYTISDGNGGTAVATVTVTVTPVNDPPVAQGQNLVTGTDQPVSGQIPASDVDGDDLGFTVVDGPGHGSVVIRPDGSYTYTPDNGYYGSDQFDVTVSDGNGGQVTVTVGVQVVEVVAPPVPPSPEPPFPPAPPVDDPNYGDVAPPVVVEGIVVDTVRGIDSLQSLGRVDLVDGAVLAAVNGVTDLHGVDLWGARSAVAAEVHRENGFAPLTRSLSGDCGLRDSLGLDARPYLGRSLEIVVGGDREHGVMIEAVRRDDSLIIGARSLMAGRDSRIAEVSLTLADGRPLPGWLEQGDDGAFWGRPPTDLKRLELIARFTFEDGEIVERKIIVDVTSGEVRFAPEKRSETGDPAPLFTTQLASAQGVGNIAALERALGL